MDVREMIARRAARELRDGEVVNLGFGIPTLVANYLPPHVKVIFQSENGILRFGPRPSLGEEDCDLANAGGEPLTLLPGACTFDVATSFLIIRGGHVDTTILGALEVDEEGNIANWAIPGKYVPGMGGAMDLLAGARKVIVTMRHVSKEGTPKIRKKCTLPLSAAKVVDLIITDKAVIEVTPRGLVLKEVAPEASIDEVVAATEANLIIGENVKKMNFDDKSEVTA